MYQIEISSLTIDSVHLHLMCAKYLKVEYKYAYK